MLTITKTPFKKFIIFFVALFFFAGCATKRSAITNHTDAFVKGADIGWLPQMEATGYKFYNDQGAEEDCFKILKDHGINTIRLRCWVNPSDDKASGHCSTEETVAMALRAKKWGMRVLIPANRENQKLGKGMISRNYLMMFTPIPLA